MLTLTVPFHTNMTFGVPSSLTGKKTSFQYVKSGEIPMHFSRSNYASLPEDCPEFEEVNCFFLWASLESQL